MIMCGKTFATVIASCISLFSVTSNWRKFGFTVIIIAGRFGLLEKFCNCETPDRDGFRVKGGGRAVVGNVFPMEAI